MSTKEGFTGKQAVIAERIQTSISYYGVFGLEPGVKPEAIKEAFFEAIRNFNPASPLTEKENLVAQVLIEAYHTLSDPVKRAKYDVRFGDIPAKKEEMPVETVNPMLWLYGDTKYKTRANYELLTKGVERYRDSRVVDFITDKKLGAACVWAIVGFARGPPKTQEFKDVISKEGVISAEAYYDQNMKILREKLKEPANYNVAMIIAAIGGFPEVKILAGEYVIDQGTIEDLEELAGRSSCTSETRLAAVQKLTAMCNKEQLTRINLHMIPPIIKFGTQEINLHTMIRDAIQGPPELPASELTPTPLLDKPGDRIIPSALPRSKAPAVLAGRPIINGDASWDLEQSLRDCNYMPPMVATQDLKIDKLGIAELFKIVQDKLPGRIRASQELIDRAYRAESVNQLLGLFAMFNGSDPISKTLKADIEGKIKQLFETQKARKAMDAIVQEAVTEFAKTPVRRRSSTRSAALKSGVPRPDPTKIRK